MALDLLGIHHLTAVTAQAARERRVLHADAGHAADQEDGEPGRHDRLSPVLRRWRRLARAPTSRSSMSARCPSGTAPMRSRDRPARRQARTISTGGRSGSTGRAMTSANRGAGRAPVARFRGFRGPAVPAGRRSQRAVRRSRGPRARCRPSGRSSGSGPITLTVPDLRRTQPVLTEVMNMREVRTYPAHEQRGADARVRDGAGRRGGRAACRGEPGRRARARRARGGVHHVAFRTPDKAEFDEWVAAAAGVRRALERRGRALLLHLALFPRAQRHPVRDRDRWSGLCRRTSRWKRSASGWPCRRSSRASARRSRRG